MIEAIAKLDWRVMRCLAAILALALAPTTSLSAGALPIVYPEGTSPSLIILHIAKSQGMFAKRQIDVDLVPITGAEIPRLDSQRPMGLIGTPAAVLQTVEGNDLRIVASYTGFNVAGQLIARPDVKSATDLRGKKVGVRVVGAGIWITTMLALQHVGLDPQRDDITSVPVGSPAQIVRALEDGSVDAALVPTPNARELKSKGFNVLVDTFPSDLAAFEIALVVSAPFLREQSDKAAGVVAALNEATAFVLSESNKSQVMEAIRTFLKIDNPAAADAAYRSLGQLRAKPHPSPETLRVTQRVMTLHDARVQDRDLLGLIDDSLVRRLEK